MMAVLFAVTYFLGRYKAGGDLAETASASAKAFRGSILDGGAKAVQSQLADVLKLHGEERAVILNAGKAPIYVDPAIRPGAINCPLVGVPCISSFSANAEILAPIYFDQEGKNLFGYLYLSREIHPDWIFLGLIAVVFILGYFSVFFGVTRITKSTMMTLASNMQAWSNRLSQNPKDAASLSETPFLELLPLKEAIEGLNYRIEGFESKAAEKAKLLILRGIGHDILGPVSQVQLYLATLKKMAESDPRYAPQIAKAMGSLKDVADVASQVKMLKATPNPQEHINLMAEVRLLVESLRESEAIRGKEIDLAFDMAAPNLETNLSTPELKRILHNLVQNSAHASKAKSRIEVAVRRDGDSAVLSVKDQGHGIPASLQEKVFQPDFTLKPGTGTGLGLAIVKHLATERQGSVKLNSGIAGTTVEVRIPIFSQGDSLCSEF